MSGNQVHRNIISSYANRLAGLAGVLVLVPLYTRFLGHRLCGEWLVITSIVPYLALANAGVDQTLVNRIAESVANERRSEVRSLLSTAFFAYCAIAVVLVGVFALLSRWMVTLVVTGGDPGASLALFLVAALYALALPWTAYSATLRGFERVDQEQAIAASTNFGRNGGLAVAVISGFGLVPLALIQGATAIVRGLAAYVRSLHLVEDAHPRWSAFSLATLGSLVRSSLGFFLLQAAGVVGFGIDNLVIGYALGPEAVTRYAVPFSLLMAASAMVSTVSIALLPTITTAYAQARKEILAAGFIVAMRLALVYGGVAAIVFWIAGPWLLRFWAGAGTFPGATTFALQLALFLLQILIAPPFAILVATTRHYGSALVHVVESGLNLFLSLWWVRVFGLSGVIAGTLVARLATSAWYIPLAATLTLDLSPSRAVREIGPGAALVLVTFSAALALWPNTEQLPIVTAARLAMLGTLLFLLAFAWFGFNRDERRILTVRLSALCRREDVV